MCARSCRNWLLLAAALWLLQLVVGAPPAPAVRVLVADFGISAGAVAVISLIGSLIGFFRGGGSSQINRALDGLRSGIVDVGKKLAEALIGFGGLLARVWGWIARHIGKLFQLIYEKLAAVVTRIARILDKIFGPIIDFLDKVKFHLKRFYDNVLRPILDIIELVRGITRLFSSLGFEWAKALDAKLAELEEKILAPYTFLVGKLNEVVNWINRIVTLDGLLQRLTLLRSLIRDAAEMTNIALNKMHVPLDGEKRDRYRRPFAPLEVSAALAVARAYVVHHDGPDRGRIDEHVADVRLRLVARGVL